MKTVSEEDLAFLSRYGFDQGLFDSWRAAVRDGRLSPETNLLRGEIHAPPDDAIADLPRKDSDEARALEAVGRDAIGRGELGVVILNGGMATRFGGVVKGTVEVLEGRSFLGLKLEDVRRCQEACGAEIPVYLMNSFATDETTRAHLADNDWFGLRPEQITCFTQFVSLRMTPKGGIFVGDDGKVSPYGTGHGDCVPALRTHGCLDAFLAGGGRHLLVSNVDNLCARPSPLVLGHHIGSEAEATVELVPKWPGDVGGAPYLVDDRVQLVEAIRFPPDFDPDIVDVFNTNTFHFRAQALEQDLDMRWYYVRKKVDGRDAVQIERLIGEVTRTLTSNYVRVLRTGTESRFLPVKTPEDLEAARDDIAAMYR